VTVVVETAVVLVDDVVGAEQKAGAGAFFAISVPG